MRAWLLSYIYIHGGCDKVHHAHLTEYMVKQWFIAVLEGALVYFVAGRAVMLSCRGRAAAEVLVLTFT